LRLRVDRQEPERTRRATPRVPAALFMSKPRRPDKLIQTLRTMVLKK